MKTNHISTIALLMLKRVWNEKRALFITMLSPVIICTAFGYVAHKSPEGISTFIVIDSPKQAPEYSQMWQIADEINDYETKDGAKPFSVTAKIDSRAEATQALDNGKTRAVILLSRSNDGINKAEVIVDATEPSIGNQFEQELPNVFDKHSKDSSAKLINEFLTQQKRVPTEMAAQTANQVMSPFQINFKTDAWKELKFFDFFASAVIVLIALGLPLFLSAVAITWDRSLGTLERIFASPYRKSEIIVGKMLANSILAIVLTILIIVTLKTVFDITLGNMGLILLLAILVALNGVIFGLLVSSVTYRETESLLLAIISLLVFMVLMTYIFPWETMHPVARYISYMIPYTYGIQAIRHVNMVGAGFADVWLDLIILFGFIVAQALIAIQVLRRQIV